VFSTAAWIIEQEYNAWKWIRGDATGHRSYSDLNTGEKLFLQGSVMAWGSAHAYVAAQPYVKIMHVAGEADMFLRAAKLNEPIGFSLSKGKVTARFAKHSAKKMLAAKIGARFIPYAGWALFAFDMWRLGKWIGKETNPFTS
jgi:hypothetical protein